MKLDDNLAPGRFIRRVNRFLVEVETAGETSLAHLPNSGRLEELLAPGSRVLLTRIGNPARKTGFDMVMVAAAGVWVCCDARLPADLLVEALERKKIKELARYTGWRREVRFEDSRLDLMLSGPDDNCLVECKSVTLVENETALFPDAPPARGTRHVTALSGAVEKGEKVAVVFVVQRPDAVSFRLNKAADPAFAEACRQAAGNGVQFLAWRCRTGRGSIELAGSIPVI